MKSPTAPGSYWLDREAAAPRRPLEGEMSADVVVVGGGIVGSFAALRLAEGGARVVLVEGDRVGRGASGRNAGFLLAEGAETTAEVARTLGEPTARALRAVGLATRAEVAEVSRGVDVGLRTVGSLRLAEDAAEAADLAATARVVGAPLRLLAAREIPPAYAGFRSTGGLLDPGDGDLHPLRLLRAVLARAEAAGVRVAERSPVLEVEEADAEAIVTTRLGRVRAGTVVLTTNAWLARFLPSGPAVRPVRAQMLAARAPGVAAWPVPFYARRGAEYGRTLADGTFLLGGLRRLGGAREETDDARPEEPVQGGLDRLLADLLPPGAAATVVARWAGTMAFTADAVPLAGRAPGRARTWVVGGCNGHGMGWGAGLARAVVDAVLARGPGPDPAFALDRASLAAPNLPEPPPRG